MNNFVLRYEQININDVDKVGGKNASLGEMFTKLKSKNINIPDGFATTANAYWDFLKENKLFDKISDILNTLDKEEYSNLQETGSKIRQLILNCQMPQNLQQQIIDEYNHLRNQYKNPIEVAVRSSATAEDLPNASFAGQQETYLNIQNEKELIEACQKCFASLFTNRAIKYREDNGFEHMKVALSIGIQKMVRSDLACSGVAFTLDTESGFEKVVYITGSWGLGENIVQGTVNPDEFYVFKPSLKMKKDSIISKSLGSKAKTMIYADDNEKVINIETDKNKRKLYVLNDEEIEQLARWCV